jgi:tetratricopeptide (TPR) repeat protein
LKFKSLFFIHLVLLSLYSCSKHKNDQAHEIINPDYDKAFDFNVLKNYDSSYIYYGKALEIFKQNKDKFGEAKCLLSMSKILTTKGNYFKAQDFSLKAKLLFDKADTTQYYHIGDNFNNLGMIANNLRNYREARDFYNSAIEYSESEASKMILFANIANIYKEEKKYTQAIKVYNSIITKVEKVDSLMFSRILSNLSYIKWLDNNNYNPQPNILKALKIQIKINDKMGQNGSYARLSDYFKNKDPQKALLYAKFMQKIAQEVKSVDDQLEAIQKISILESENFSTNFNHYVSLRDSIQNARNTDTNKFATIVYGVEEAKLQNEENKNYILKQRFGIGTLSLFLIGGFFYYRRRKQRLLLESENKLKEQQLKTSKKVHDVVANGIYQVMTKIENQNDFNKEQALDELEFVYEKSRDISYENTDSHDEKFNEKISKLVASFKNDEINTFTVRNQEETWENVTKSTQTEIYQIIRELLVNMKKHSEANNVVFKFEKTDNLININYADNGIGISDELIFKNGLSNTVSRIENINGKITFETKTEKGLKVNISFPVS